MKTLSKIAIMLLLFVIPALVANCTQSRGAAIKMKSMMIPTDFFLSTGDCPSDYQVIAFVEIQCFPEIKITHVQDDYGEQFIKDIRSGGFDSCLPLISAEAKKIGANGIVHLRSATSDKFFGLANGVVYLKPDETLIYSGIAIRRK